MPCYQELEASGTQEGFKQSIAGLHVVQIRLTCAICKGGRTAEMEMPSCFPLTPGGCAELWLHNKLTSFVGARNVTWGSG